MMMLPPEATSESPRAACAWGAASAASSPMAMAARVKGVDMRFSSRWLFAAGIAPHRAAIERHPPDNFKQVVLPHRRTARGDAARVMRRPAAKIGVLTFDTNEASCRGEERIPHGRSFQVGQHPASQRPPGRKARQGLDADHP